jgi:uncharacterized membrane protein (UPF0127 family)
MVSLVEDSMRKIYSRLDRAFATGLLATALVLSSLANAADKTPAPKTLTLTIGKHAIRAEIAQSDEERERGLMFRVKLGKNDGMVFTFDDPGYHSMWMMNTLIPLSVAFLDSNGVILNVEDMEPQTTDSHTAAGPASYAIETNKGWFAERRIGPGDKVAGLPRIQPKK